MSTQTSVVTEAASNAAAQNAADYANSVAKHISGDYAQHNQVNVFPGPYTYSGGFNRISNTLLVRMLVTLNGNDYAIIVPGFPVGTYTGGGTDSGGFSQIAPQFTLQPVGVNQADGSLVTLTVAVAGTQPILLQWFSNGSSDVVNLDFPLAGGSPISGATSATYSFILSSSSFFGTAGNYYCLATNAIGRTASNIATVTVGSSLFGSPIRS